MIPVSSSYGYEAQQRRLRPVYLLHFDSYSKDYVTRDRITGTTYTVAELLTVPKGNTQQITPEEGKSSIGQITAGILDKDNEITSLIANDPANMHRVMTTIKAGYSGMAESEMSTRFTGWVTDINIWKQLGGYDFVITDPQRFFQKRLFKSATNSETVYLSGNPLNIMLGLLTSTGSYGSNGTYDVYSGEWGCGIDQSLINVANIEKQRDWWFPCERWQMTITKPIVAKRFLEDEFFKICNIYPIVRGDGVFDIKVYHGPLPIEDVQGFDETNIIDRPEWDQNLSAVINEIDAQYDHDPVDDEYDQPEFHVHAASLALRKEGKKPLELKSKGLRTALAGAAFIQNRVYKVFDRYASPPPSVSIKAMFNRHLSEPGDIVPVSHRKIPDLVVGSRGISSHYMEVIKHQPMWDKGYCKFQLLYTSWSGEQFMCISPTMQVLSGVNQYQFTVTSADRSRYAETFVIDVLDYQARSKASCITINSLDPVTHVITVGSMGVTPTSGDLVQFTNSYAALTFEQQRYWAVSSEGMMTDTRTAYLIVA